VKIGVFGGTFDPPHIGHLIAAQDAADALRLDRLLFVPAGSPPHKRERVITPAPLRLEMLNAALIDEPRFQVCDLELRREGPSFTADTLRELNRLQPRDELYLLLGADQVRDLPGWYQPEEVARLSRIVLISRAGIDAAPNVESMIFSTVRITRIDVSASEIRQRVADRRSIRYLVPRAVESIIYEHGLYLNASVTDRRPQVVAPDGDAKPGVTS
jgi:nicotinate-nucleotide adenylyltransferase